MLSTKETIHYAQGTKTVSEKKQFSFIEAKQIGDALGIRWDKFGVAQFRMGLNIELEHGRRDPATDVTHDEPLLTGKIALAHLKEIPDYYTRLAAMGHEVEERIRLGRSDVHISPLGLGTWAWGDTSVWGYGESYGDADLKQAYNASLRSGVNFIDTAEAYAAGKSERILGRFVRETSTRNRVIIATKFVPQRWRFMRRQLVGALRSSLKRFGLLYVDLYQIHWPRPPVSIETWMHALADAVEAGLTRAVGVSNYTVEETMRAHAVLATRGVPLASNQIPYSLLHRTPEKNGMIDLCRELGITIIAHSPLNQGILTGKYTPENPPPGPRGQRYNREYLTKTQPLLGLMKEIGQAHDGKSPAQVALNWTVCKGTVPIPGAKNLKQAQENLGSLGWRLSDGEVMALDRASES